MDADETPASALLRELAEEPGLEDARIEDPVWRLTRVFPLQDWDGQTDTTHLVRAARFGPRPRVDPLAENVDDLRWFSPREVTAGDVTSSPRDLAVQVAIVLTEGVPDPPREVPALD